MRNSIAALLAEGRLAGVTPDTAEARQMLAQAEAHLRTAAAAAADDPAGAYQLLYDAARKAAAADMLANGYRVKADRPGAHAAVVAYAQEALSGEADENALQNFDRMRRHRNRSEYGAATPTQRQVDADLAHARAIVNAVVTRLAHD